MTITPHSVTRRRARRQHGLNILTYIEVWDYSDNEIIGAAFETWRSPAYSHYIVHLERHHDAQGMPHHLSFRFECRYDRPSHLVQYRDRSKTGNGTQNLLSSAKTCESRWGVPTHALSSHHYFSSYSVAKHRTLIAMRCAQNKRSFNSVADDLYQQEVELLRPGTSLPSPMTVSRDVQVIYETAAAGVKKYLQSIPGALHLAIDGWTSPQASSFLGIILIWRDQGKAWRCVLEFVQLTHAHKGDYLASRTAECLKRYGIENRILSICLDNASNNKTLVENLALQIPAFRGPQSRIRCFPHVINLMAKAFLLLFSKPPRRKKVATTSAISNKAQANTQSSDPKSREKGAEDIEDFEDFEDVNTPAIDDDKQEYDDRVVQKLKKRALDLMAAEGVVLTSEQLQEGQTLMPKVAGLARRVHDSAALREHFEQLVAKDSSLVGDQRALTERVATRWDTEHDCLESHIHFKMQTQLLTANSKLKLKAYALSDSQWALADEMVTALEIFKERSTRFSLAEVPLLHETLPELMEMKGALEDVCNDAIDMSPITRVAARAALLVHEKYAKIMKESEMYYISIAMCPTLKLTWFYDNGYSPDEISEIRNKVINQFHTSYSAGVDSRERELHPSEQGFAIESRPVKRVNKYLQRHSHGIAYNTSPGQDSIEKYLSEKIVEASDLEQYGGLLGYCTHQLAHQPRVYTMALDYLTAPASSVNAERAFSNGRLMVNHLQHQMSTRTFQAQMAVGSWVGTPLLPDLTQAAEAFQASM